MPPTPKAEPLVELPEPPEEAGLSNQAQFSTYSEDDDPTIDKDANPPDGPHVKQEKGKPSEGKAKAFGAK